MYPHDGVIDPERQVAAYARATDAAGFTGFRIVAEATSLVRTPEQRDAFVRYEHLVDGYMARRPFSALCAYCVDDLGDDAVA